MFSAGVRAHYQASQLAAPKMIAQGGGDDRANTSTLGRTEASARRLWRVESRYGQDDR